MRKSIRLGFLLSTVVLDAGIVLAQTGDRGTASDQAADAPQISTVSSDSEPSPVDAYQAQAQYVPALNGSGMFSLQQIQSFHILGGGSVYGGMDTNPDNTSEGKPSTLYAFSPYVSVLAGNPRTQFLFQYHPTITRYASYAPTTMHQASAKVMGNLSPRWSWTLGVNGLHGDNSVRFVAASQTVAVGGVAGTGSNSAAYLPNAGLVTNIDSAFDLLYDMSPRDGLGIQVSNGYSSYPNLHETGSVAGEMVNFAHAVRSTFRVLAYQQSSQYYGDLECTTFGGGLGFTWQPREAAMLSVEGGPQFNTTSCKNQQGFSYHARFSTKVQGKSQLYATADRQPLTGFLGPGLWQDDFSGGLQRDFLIKNTVGGDLGYVRSSTLSNSGTYAGFFADLAYSRHIKGPLDFSCKYQNFMGSQGTTQAHRNVVLFSLSLTPESRSLTH